MTPLELSQAWRAVDRGLYDRGASVTKFNLLITDMFRAQGLSSSSFCERMHDMTSFMGPTLILADGKTGAHTGLTMATFPNASNSIIGHMMKLACGDAVDQSTVPYFAVDAQRSGMNDWSNELAALLFIPMDILTVEIWMAVTVYKSGFEAYRLFKHLAATLALNPVGLFKSNNAIITKIKRYVQPMAGRPNAAIARSSSLQRVFGQCDGHNESADSICRIKDAGIRHAMMDTFCALADLLNETADEPTGMHPESWMPQLIFDTSIGESIAARFLQSFKPARAWRLSGMYWECIMRGICKAWKHAGRNTIHHARYTRLVQCVFRRFETDNPGRDTIEMAHDWEEDEWWIRDAVDALYMSAVRKVMTAIMDSRRMSPEWLAIRSRDVEMVDICQLVNSISMSDVIGDDLYSIMKDGLWPLMVIAMRPAGNFVSDDNQVLHTIIGANAIVVMLRQFHIIRHQRTGNMLDVDECDEDDVLCSSDMCVRYLPTENFRELLAWEGWEQGTFRRIVGGWTTVWRAMRDVANVEVEDDRICAANLAVLLESPRVQKDLCKVEVKNGHYVGWVFSECSQKIAALLTRVPIGMSDSLFGFLSSPACKKPFDTPGEQRIHPTHFLIGIVFGRGAWPRKKMEVQRYIKAIPNSFALDFTWGITMYYNIEYALAKPDSAVRDTDIEDSLLFMAQRVASGTATNKQEVKETVTRTTQLPHGSSQWAQDNYRFFRRAVAARLGVVFTVDNDCRPLSGTLEAAIQAMTITSRTNSLRRMPQLLPELQSYILAMADASMELPDEHVPGMPTRQGITSVVRRRVHEAHIRNERTLGTHRKPLQLHTREEEKQDKGAPKKHRDDVNDDMSN